MMRNSKIILSFHIIDLLKLKDNLKCQSTSLQKFREQAGANENQETHLKNLLP